MQCSGLYETVNPREWGDRMLDLLITSFFKGGVYILISMGLTLVYGVMRISNFAHGECYLVGTYAVYFGVTKFGMNPFLAILFAAVVGFVLGAVVERLCFHPLRRKADKDWIINTFLVSAGLSFILQNGLQMLFTANQLGVPYLWQGTITIGSIRIPLDRLIAFFVALLFMGGFYLFLNKSKTGSAIRAVSEDETGAMLMGVNISSIHTLTFGLSTMLAAVAGAALISVTPAYPTGGEKPLYTAWFVVILVGLGNLEATIVGSFAVALIESLSNYYFGAIWQECVSLAVIILVLIFKPAGLFGKKAKV